MAEKFRLERRNPLPVGRYWQDIFEFPNRPQFAAFEDWLKQNSDRVDVVTREDYEAGGLPFDRSQDFPPRRWYLFDVLEPVRWEGPGLPTIATPEVKSSDDTMKSDEEIVKEFPSAVPGMTNEELENATKKAGVSLVANLALGAGIAIGIAAAVSRFLR